ncbi:MAG: 4-hydroxyphenylpyruvate dioxygenase [Coleofasciculaceae cyanobacterium]
MNINCIHFYVENANESRDWFVKQMGFQAIASGANCHTLTNVVNSGAVTIVLSSPLTSASPVAQFLRRHPPGVADVVFAVSDLPSLLRLAIANGAKVLQQSQGGRKWAKIAAWGGLTHTLIEFSGADHSSIPIDQAFLLSIVPTDTPVALSFFELKDISTTELDFFSGIDHVVLNVPTGDLEAALSWYEDVLGFRRRQSFTIQTEQSGLRSQVLVHPISGVQFPINEPTSANSQVQEFLNANQGAGIQHIALKTPQIVEVIAQLRAQGLAFLPIPASYYIQLHSRYQELNLSLAEFEKIAAQEILVDWDKKSPQALLLQTFTKPIFEKPTFFFELIERRQEAQGFGEGNFRALFEAIEREQMKRGSLPLR